MPSAIEDLQEVLRRERHLLHLVLFRCVELRLLLEAREVRFLLWAVQDADRIHHQVREIDRERVAQVQRLGIRGAAGPLPTLTELGEAMGEPWTAALSDHRDRLTELVAEIEAEGRAAAEQARSGIRAVAHGAVPAGALVDRLPATDRDQSLLAADTVYRRSLRAATRLRVPALSVFLRG